MDENPRLEKIDVQFIRQEQIMKKALCICLLTAFLVPAVLADDIIKREYEISKGGNLILETEIGGDIYVKGWEEDKVIVKAEVIDVDDDAYELYFDQSSSRLKIEVDKKRNWRKRDSGKIDFFIKVPAEFNIEIETTGGPVTIEDIKGDVGGQTAGGSLEFSGIEGNINFQTMGGSIEAKRINGQLNLKTMGGSVTVLDSKVDGKVSTMGGSIRIEDVDGDLDGSTMGGSVTYRNVTGRSSTSPQKPLHITTMGGSIQVDEAPGGAELDTKGGSIEVNKAGNYVKAETMGGSIIIREIDGWVDATTMGGSVEVNMVGDPDKGNRDVYLSSKGGDIELTVPRGLSMDFDIELAITRDAREDYDIYSDFDLDKKKTGKWESFWGSKRKYIYGTGEHEGGKNKIRIATINGDVIIRDGGN